MKPEQEIRSINDPEIKLSTSRRRISRGYMV